MEIMKLKIDMFTTANDTDQWVLAIDGYFGFFKSEQETELALNPINDEHFDDSGYGSMQVIAPKTVLMAVNYDKPGNPVESISTCLISDVKSIDIAGYILKHADRQYQKMLINDAYKKDIASGFYSISEKLNAYKEDKERDKFLSDRRKNDPDYLDFMGLDFAQFLLNK